MLASVLVHLLLEKGKEVRGGSPRAVTLVYHNQLSLLVPVRSCSFYKREKQPAAVIQLFAFPKVECDFSIHI